MTEGLADERDSALWAKVRELIWKNVSATNEEKAMDFEKLLALLSIRNRTSRAFNPVGILRDFENLGFEIKKIQSHVKKLADSEQHRGIGYIARIVKEHCSADKSHAVDEWEDYPGEVVEKRIKKMFSGFPMAAAVVLMLLSGTGLAFSAIGILKTIGLL